MACSVETVDEFTSEFAAFEAAVQTEIAVMVRLLEAFGPVLRRPHCDTLNGSKFANMKELRFSAADGEWRLAFAFDPERKAILLVAGDKSGVSQKRFYKALVQTADTRFERHLSDLKTQERKP